MNDIGIALSKHEERRAQGRMLLGASIGMFLNPSALVLFSFGVYLLPIVQDTGWDRGFVASSIGAAGIMIALSPPLVGWLINRYGPRRVSTIGFPLCGVAMMLLALPTSQVMFAVALGLFGLLAGCQIAVVYIYCLSGWFDRRRGTAIGIALACTGLSIAVIPPVAVWMMGSLGWRGTYVAFGLIVVLIGLPVTRWLVIDPPVVARSKAQGDVPGVTYREALRMRVFWLLAAAIFLVGTAVSGGMTNLNLLLIERGVSAQSASFILSVVGITMIFARLLCGALFDRMNGRNLTALICAVVCLAFVVLLVRGDVVGVMIAAVLIGFGFGAEGDALSYMTSRLFGMRAFGTIFGSVFLAFTASGAAGQVLYAVTRARTGSYDTAMWMSAGACAVATILALTIRTADLKFITHHADHRASDRAGDRAGDRVEHDLRPLAAE